MEKNIIQQFKEQIKDWYQNSKYGKNMVQTGALVGTGLLAINAAIASDKIDNMNEYATDFFENDIYKVISENFDQAESRHNHFPKSRSQHFPINVGDKTLDVIVVDFSSNGFVGSDYTAVGAKQPTVPEGVGPDAIVVYDGEKAILYAQREGVEPGKPGKVPTSWDGPIHNGLSGKPNAYFKTDFKNLPKDFQYKAKESFSNPNATKAFNYAAKHTSFGANSKR